MNEQRIKEIEDGCNAATVGPWWVEYREYTDASGMIRYQPTVTTQDTDISIVYVDADAEGDLSPDAAFIANARTDVPQLIAEVRRLKSYGDTYRSLEEVRRIERDNLAAKLTATSEQQYKWKVVGLEGYENVFGNGFLYTSLAAPVEADEYKSMRERAESAETKLTRVDDYVLYVAQSWDANCAARPFEEWLQSRR